MNEKVLLAIGAHADDCIFGLAGTMLLAKQKGYKVVILNLIKWYRHGKKNENFLKYISAINESYGAKTEYLDFKSGEIEVTQKTIRKVAGVIIKYKPSIAFQLWPKDTHYDHITTASICHSALQMAGRITCNKNFLGIWERFQYDNGPAHTIDYTPNIFIDITSVWERAYRWTGEIGSLYQDQHFSPKAENFAQKSKAIICGYRGLSCGKKYIETFKSSHQPTSEIL